MGISAVRATAKTWTLSYLAADLIQSGFLAPDRNPDRNPGECRCRQFFHPYLRPTSGKKPFSGFGYRVRTLHGLANDIVLNA